MRSILWRLFTIVLLMWSPVGAEAQQPFSCSGRMFRVIEAQGGSVFEEIFLEDNWNVRFEERQTYFGEQLNGIAFHPSQRLIYGVQLGKEYRLCRIDSEYRLESLRTLPLPTDMLFVSGDISPDERYLVLLGYSPDETTNLLALVDLTDPEFQTKLIPLQTTNPAQKIIYCADIAFHPTDNRLYGFDHLGERLVQINLEQRSIDNSTYPVTEVLAGNVPSIFFDAFGRLYGIGAPYKGLATNRRLYQFNLEDGSAEELSKLSFEGNQDACSCPYQVKLLKRVSSRRAAPCTRLTFEFVVINRTDFIQEGVTFRDTFPPGFTIQSISSIPYGGSLEQGPGSNLLVIRSMEIPVGTDTFSVEVELDPEILAGPYENRAHLGPVLLSDPMQKEWLRSDDPDTPQPDDATRFEVSDLEIDFSNDSDHLCEGDTLLLDPDVEGALGYHWNTGEDSEVIQVVHPGLYVLTITTPCEETTGRIRIQRSQIEVNLGPDRRVEKGTPVILYPETPARIALAYLWHTAAAIDLPCKTCVRMEIAPAEDLMLEVTVADEHGCQARDSVRIETMAFSLYAPNAFSPNGDGNNDRFYLQSRLAQKIEQFRVFDRWGNLLYEHSGGQTNTSAEGWDGHYRGRLMNAGAYTWYANILTPEGKSALYQGTVQLMR